MDQDLRKAIYFNNRQELLKHLHRQGEIDLELWAMLRDEDAVALVGSKQLDLEELANHLAPIRERVEAALDVAFFNEPLALWVSGLYRYLRHLDYSWGTSKLLKVIRAEICQI